MAKKNRDADKKPIIINMPDHSDYSDKKNKKPGSDMHHHSIEQTPPNTHDIRREHDKTKGTLHKNHKK